jgi:ribonuclease T1
VFPIALVSLGKALIHTLQRVVPEGSAGSRTMLARPERSVRRVLARAASGATLALVAALVVTTAVVPAAEARTREARSEIVTVALASLPAQAQTTFRLIESGGPFPYPKDGTVFGNRERLLPAQSRGYYREYTVKTPGSRDRGARRIICGGTPPQSPEACFYTEDHYASFRRIVQ